MAIYAMQVWKLNLSLLNLSLQMILFLFKDEYFLAPKSADTEEFERKKKIASNSLIIKLQEWLSIGVYTS